MYHFSPVKCINVIEGLCQSFDQFQLSSNTVPSVSWKLTVTSCRGGRTHVQHYVSLNTSSVEVQ